MLPSIFNHRNSTPASFMDDFFSNSFLSGLTNWNSAFENSGMPAVNVEETDKEYLIDVAAPGLDKKDFKISLEEGALIISSQKENKKEDKKDGYLRREFNYNSFCRSFALPEDAVAEKIKASHKNGVLTISIPKSEAKNRATKEISIA